MTKANECTCPSGDGSLRHPCPAHPAVEQAGGDERAAFELFVRKHCGMPEHIAVNWDAKFTNDAWEGWQARAALAQPSPAIAAAPTYQFQSREIGESDWAPCDFRWYLYCSKSPEMDTRVVEVAAQPSPAQAEQAEAERPEMVAWQYRVTAGPQTGWSLWHPGKGEEFERSYTVERRPLMTIAQHEYIVGELLAVIAQLRQHKNDYMDSGQETYRALQNEIREREAEIARLDGLVSGRTAERDAALARVAELERKLRNEENAHTTTIEQRDNDEHWVDQLAKAIAERFGVDIGEHSNLNCPWNEALVWMQQPPAQAQHSVPEGWMLVECGIWTQEQVDEMQKTVARFRSSEFVDDRALAMAVADAGQCKAPEISLAELLAAAPGKEG